MCFAWPKLTVTSIFTYSEETCFVPFISFKNVMVRFPSVSKHSYWGNRIKGIVFVNRVHCFIVDYTAWVLLSAEHLTATYSCLLARSFLIGNNTRVLICIHVFVVLVIHHGSIIFLVAVYLRSLNVVEVDSCTFLLTVKQLCLKK